MGSAASCKTSSRTSTGAPPRASTSGTPDMNKLQNVLERFQISVAEANDLVALQDYEIVAIADDSGSMSCGATPVDQRILGQPSPSRWDELKDTLALIVEMGACFDASGLDIYFLNRKPIKNVKSASDRSFVDAFRTGPAGSTPLTETLRTVAQACGGEKPVLLFILTDGQPNGGTPAFRQELSRLVKKQSTQHTFKVQIMACTDDEAAVGYLDEIDRDFPEIDTTDDYYSEMKQVLKDARKVSKFSRADWCMKAMLGPVSAKFDGWDEPAPLEAPKRAMGGA